MLEKLRARSAALAALSVSVVFLWQALSLNRWSLLGPGPGLFPQLIAVACVALSLILLVTPSSWAEKDDDDEAPEEAPGFDERRTFVIYSVTLVATALLTDVVGFFLTSVGLSLALIWFAGRRPLWRALVFGVTAGLIGDIGFGYYMTVELPTSEIDRIIFRFFR